jgi:predicted GIY-YIG superfamily endonuclease
VSGPPYHLSAYRPFRERRLPGWRKYAKAPYYAYALLLADNCAYAGMTSNMPRRLRRHWTGRGSEWTIRHPPTEILNIVPCASAAEAWARENELLRDLAAKFGAANARGGKVVDPDCLDEWVPPDLGGAVHPDHYSVAQGSFLSREEREAMERDPP